MHLSHFPRPYFILMYATFARIVECKTLYAIYRIFTELFTKLYMYFTELHIKILFRHTLYKNPISATGCKQRHRKHLILPAGCHRYRRTAAKRAHHVIFVAIPPCPNMPLPRELHSTSRPAAPLPYLQQEAGLRVDEVRLAT
jgi:hypothetical protein